MYLMADTTLLIIMTIDVLLLFQISVASWFNITPVRAVQGCEEMSSVVSTCDKYQLCILPTQQHHNGISPHRN